MPTNVWLHKLKIGDVFHNEEMELPAKGQIIVDRIRSQPFYKNAMAEDSDDRGELEQIIEELEDAAKEDDVHWFDLVWNAFYDWADANRVWVETVHMEVKE